MTLKTTEEGYLGGLELAAGTVGGLRRRNIVILRRHWQDITDDDKSSHCQELTWCCERKTTIIYFLVFI